MSRTSSSRTRFATSVALAGAIVALVAPAALADTITPVGNVTGEKYRGGVAANGGISYAVGLQVQKNSDGVTVAVRPVGRITKLSKASAVQVDSVALETATSTLVKKSTAANSGTTSSVLSAATWKSLQPGTCLTVRSRASFSIRWTDGALSRFTQVSPLTKVCRTAAAPTVVVPSVPTKPADKDCGDFPTHAAAQSWFNTYYPYYGDFANLDSDHDLIACETLP